MKKIEKLQKLLELVNTLRQHHSEEYISAFLISQRHPAKWVKHVMNTPIICESKKFIDWYFSDEADLRIIGEDVKFNLREHGRFTMTDIKLFDSQETIPAHICENVPYDLQDEDLSDATLLREGKTLLFSQNGLVTIDYDYFISNMKLVHNHIDENAGYDGFLFETYGQELEYVLSQIENGTVLTLIDCGDEERSITQGYHLVNRLGYFILEEPPLFNYDVIDA